MSNIPEELMFTDSHEWIRSDGDDTVTIGITDHAQELLGDLVYVELPEIGQQLDAGAEAGVVESVKAASDIYSPVSGEVIEINEDLADAPETINEQPYDGGWIFKVRLSNASELDALLNAEAYTGVVEAEDH